MEPDQLVAQKRCATESWYAQNAISGTKTLCHREQVCPERAWSRFFRNLVVFWSLSGRFLEIFEYFLDIGDAKEF